MSPIITINIANRSRIGAKIVRQWSSWPLTGTPVDAKYKRESIAKWAFVGGAVVRNISSALLKVGLLNHPATAFRRTDTINDSFFL